MPPDDAMPERSKEIRLDSRALIACSDVLALSDEAYRSNAPDDCSLEAAVRAARALRRRY